MAWEDFGQKVDLTARIREILINYPEGTSILKEFIQNADDARASCIRFCLDHRQHTTDDLLGPGMAAFQGPALVVMNDALFSEADFTSISRIGDSVKRVQTGKTGRFGIGFNSCYHVTDMPTFVSGNNLVIFDPHCKYLPNISSSNPGKKINFVEALSRTSKSGNEPRVAMGQLAPFQGLFGCDLMHGHACPYTVFRLPLRSAELAAQSNISKQVYGADKVRDLLRQLAIESHSILLFLKTVAQVEIYEWCEGQPSMTKIFTCQISNVTQQLAADRSLFVRASANFGADKSNNPKPVQGSVFVMDMEMKYHTSSWCDPTPVTAQADTDSEPTAEAAAQAAQAVQAPSGVVKRYMVSQQLGGGAVDLLAQQLSQQFAVPLLPWAAVAADITPSSTTGAEPLKGQAYCFLPLPAMTGLPVHVNAFFELSSNRRDIWHGEDMAGLGAARAAWNKALLADVAADAYASLIMHAAITLGPGPVFNSLWPYQYVQPPWQALLKALYMRVAGLPVAHTAASGGQWLRPSEGLLPDQACLSTPVLARALEAAGLPLLDVPQTLVAMWSIYLPEPPHEVTPVAVRSHLRSLGSAKQASAVNSSDIAAAVLTYCLEGVQYGSPTHVLQQLEGLRIIPVLDGSVAAFKSAAGLQESQQPGALFVAAELELRLLQDATPELMVDFSNLNDETVSRLWAVAQLRVTNVSIIDIRAMAQQLLPCLLRPVSTAGNKQPALVAEWGTGRNLMSRKRLADLWSWLSEQDNLSDLAGLPILPVLPPNVTSNSLTQPSGHGQLAGLDLKPHTAVICVTTADLQLLASYLEKTDKHSTPASGIQQASSTDEKTTSQQPHAESAAEALVLHTLLQVGVSITDTITLPELPLSLSLLGASHCHTFDGPGVISALTHLSQTRKGKADLAAFWKRQFEGVPAHQRFALKQFLLTNDCLRTVTRKGLIHAVQKPQLLGEPDQMLKTLAALPIYVRASASTTAPGADLAHFCDLTPPCFLQPPGFDASRLYEKYVVAHDPSEASLLCDFLGVTQITPVQAYRQHVLPILPQLHPSLRQALTIQLLRDMAALLASDPSLATLLKDKPIVTNNAGEACSPSQLYDPRNQDLAVLLDPDHAFPAAAFREDEAVLNGLALLGMQQQADRRAVIQAAQYIQQAVDKAASMTTEGTETQVAQEARDMAVARAKALLAYLELEAGQLSSISQDTYSRSGRLAAAQGSSQQHQRHSSNGGLGGIAARRIGSFFSKVQGVLTGGQEETFTNDKAQREQAAAEQRQAVERQQLEVLNFWTELASIRWCPVLATAPMAGVSWHAVAANASNCPVAAPNTIRPLSDMWLASASLHILDGECRSTALADGLGWSSPLSGGVLGNQLKQLGLMHQTLGEVDANQTQPSKQDLAQQLAEVVPQLYRALAGLSASQLAAACSLLAGAPSVWVGRGFVPATRVAFQGSLDMSPWLYVLPAELSPFKQLLKQFGATESFSAQQYIGLLKDIFSTTIAKSGKSPEECAVSPPLDAQQLNQVIAAIQALADILVQAPQTGPTSGIYVPDEEGCLAPATDLAFNDAPWMLGGAMPADTPTNQEGLGVDLSSLRLVHPKISHLVAERVGVPSLRRLLLAQSSDSVSLSLVTRTVSPIMMLYPNELAAQARDNNMHSGAAEAFGQSEALTTRLRHIIHDYVMGPGVLMELLQNADDAGASQLKLMLDCSTYNTSSILSPAMAALQGPALLAFNDAMFSPSDFAAIARIGQDSKLGRPATTGRFGLGFNAVYHLTDVPSFVSGDYVVLFDPHARYLPGVSYAQPGLRFAFQRANLLAQFPDAFAPYIHFGCTLKEPYQGTLFRFPLRTEDMAARSDIKPGSPCTPADVLSLLQAFRSHLPQALLFLKNVRNVEVSIRLDGQPNIKLLYSASALPPSVGGSTTRMSLQEPVVKFLKDAAAATAAGTSTSDSQRVARALAKVEPRQLPSCVGPMELTLTSYDETDAHATAILSKQSTTSDGGQLANTADAVSEPSSNGVVQVSVSRAVWLVCNAIGGGTARDIAVEAANTSGVKMIPWVGIAACIPTQHPHLNKGSNAALLANNGQGVAADGYSNGEHIEGQVAIESASEGDGQAFCFLPLPIKTGLPVHVNAFFELSSNRRDIWYGEDMTGSGAKRAAWNVALLKDALVPAYLRLLVELSAELGPGPGLFRLFPAPHLQEPWSHLCQSFYRALSDQKLVWVDAQGGRWMPPSQVILAHTAPESLSRLLAALDMPIARHLPAWLEQAMLELTPKVTPLTPALVRSHLQALTRVGEQSMHTLAGRLAVYDKQQGCSRVEDSAAVQLLEYCLSDIQTNLGTNTQQNQVRSNAALLQDAKKALAVLDSCQLLPLVDGSLGAIHSGSGMTAAMLSSAGLQPGMAVYLVPTSDIEAALLEALPGRAVSLGVPERLRSKLLQLSQLGQEGGVLNVVALTPQSLSDHVLPRLLPSSWRGKDVVDWQHDSSPQGSSFDGWQLTPAWLQKLWHWLAAYLSPQEVQALAAWPLIPVKGNKLAACHPGSKVLLEGDWHEYLTGALTQLGCMFLDTQLLTQTTLLSEPVPVTTQPSPTPETTSQTDGTSAGAHQNQLPADRFVAASMSSLLSSQALQLVVRPATLLGILEALKAVKQSHSNSNSSYSLQSTGNRSSDGSRRTSLSRPSVGIQMAAVPETAFAWPSLRPEQARQLRSYLLQEKWFANGEGHAALETDLLNILTSLPIFEVHRSNMPSNTASTVTTAADQQGLSSDTQRKLPPSTQDAAGYQRLTLFTALDHKVMYLPPEEADSQLLTLQLPANRPMVYKFLKCDHAGEARVMLTHLGVSRLDLPAFLTFLLSLVQGGTVPRNLYDAFLLGLLHKLHKPAYNRQLGPQSSAQTQADTSGAELAAVTEALRDMALFPVQGKEAGAGAQAFVNPSLLRTPRQLADMRNPQLSHLLDASLFSPATPYSSDPVALDVLCQLGMHKTVTLQLLVVAAEAISQEYQNGVSSQPDQSVLVSTIAVVPVWVQPILLRAHAVLRTLNALTQSMMSSADAQSGDLNNEQQQLLWQKLQQLTWCPVMLTPPEPGLPWPAQGQPVLAPPRLLRLPTEAWIVSATLHLLDTQKLNAPQSDIAIAQPGSSSHTNPTSLLCEKLGWSGALPRASVLCAQLMELGRLNPVVAELHLSDDSDANDAVEPEEQPIVDDHRQETEDKLMEAPSVLETSAIATSETATKTQSVVAADSDAALQCRQRDCLERGLHQLYKALSEVCEGPQVDLVTMTFERGDAGCIWVGEGLVAPSKAVLSNATDVQTWQPWIWGVPDAFQQYASLFSLLGVSDQVGTAHYKGALTEIARLAGSDPLSDSDLKTVLLLAEALESALADQGQSGTMLQGLLLPDVSSIMTPPGAMYFNDADWLSTEGLVLAHPNLPHHTAEALGVRSLRYRQQQASQSAGLPHSRAGRAVANLTCLSASLIGQALGLQEHDPVTPSVVMSFLADLTEVADLLGVTLLHVTLDTQQHPAQSLLHPGLSRFQGPALCITLPGVEVTPQELCDLLASQPNNSGNADMASAVRVHGAPVVQGLGLLAAFAISEVVQVVSGSVTYMWDPAGKTLQRSAQETDKAAGTGPCAQQYRHVEARLPVTFADQYGSAWSFAEGCDLTRHISSTLIRLPLTGLVTPVGTKQRQGSLPWSTASLDVVQQALHAWQPHASRSLLFCHKLQAISIRRLEAQPKPNPTSPVKQPRAQKVLPTTVFQAALSWDPEKPRHTFGLRDGVTNQEGAAAAAAAAANKQGIAKGFLTAAFGKVTGAVGAAAAAIGGGDAPRRPPPAQQHRTLLELVTTGLDQAAVHESWLVSTHYQECLTRHGSAVTSGTKDTLSAVAICLTQSCEGGQEMLPSVSGLHPMLVGDTSHACLPSSIASQASTVTPITSPTKAASGNNTTPSTSARMEPSAVQPPVKSAKEAVLANGPGACLGRLPFLVYGSFFWSRSAHGQRRIVPLSFQDEQQEQPGSNPGSPRGPTSSQVPAAIPAVPQSGTVQASNTGVSSSQSSMDPTHRTPPPQPPQELTTRQPNTQTQPDRHSLPRNRTSSSQQDRVPTLAISPHMLARSHHNKRTCEGLAAAWLVAARWVLSQPHLQSNKTTNTRSSYRHAFDMILPDLAAVQEAGDELSMSTIKQMYLLAAHQPMWRLHRGGWVTLKDGFFMPPDTNNAFGKPAHTTGQMNSLAEGLQQVCSLESDASAFLYRYMPILDCPWQVYNSLQLASVPFTQLVTPASVRTFLKQNHVHWVGHTVHQKGMLIKHYSGSHHHGGSQSVHSSQEWHFTWLELQQLLKFCMSDILKQQQHESYNSISSVTEAPRATDQAQNGSVSDQVDAGDLAGLLGLAANNISDLLTNVNQSVGRAIDTIMDPLNPSNPAPTNQAPTTSPVPVSRPAAPSVTQLDRPAAFDFDKLRQCQGIPIATAASKLQGLHGTADMKTLNAKLAASASALMVIPAECGAGAYKLLPPNYHTQLLAEQVVQVLTSGPVEGLLRDPAARAELGLRLYSFKDLSKQLMYILPADWIRRNIEPAVSGYDIPGATPVEPSTVVASLGNQVLAGRGAQSQQRGVGGLWELSGLQIFGQQPRELLGVSWEPGKGECPTAQWLGSVAELVSGLCDVAPKWQDASVRLSDLDGWPLLPVLPMGKGTALAGSESRPGHLVYMAHRAAVTALPAEFFAAFTTIITETVPATDNDHGDMPEDARIMEFTVQPVSQQQNQGMDLTPSSEPLTLDQLCNMASSRGYATVLRALVLCGCPVLDPRFNKHLAPLCVPHIDLNGPITVLIHKLRWVNETLTGKTDARSLRNGTGSSPALGLDTSAWDDALREDLLMLIADNIPGSLSPEDVAFLRVLPLYPSLAGHYVMLTTDTTTANGSGGGMVEGGGLPACCTRELFDPLHGLLEALPESSLKLLLQAKPGLSRLYEVLGVPSLTVAGLLGLLVVPILTTLPETVQAHVLTYIQFNWSSLKSEASLIAALKECAFVVCESVPGEAGPAVTVLKRPCDLYDPTHPLYGAVYHGTGRFPGGQYAFPNWLTVLRDVGLVHEVSTAQFLSAARHVQECGKVLKEAPAVKEPEKRHVMHAAQACMTHLGSHFHTLLGKDFYTSLAEIAFVPARLGIPGSPAATPILAKYSEAAATKDWALCWSVLPIIEQPEGWSVPSSVAPHFRLRSPPPFAVILQHLRNVGSDGGEEVLGSWPAAAPLTAAGAYDAVLDYMTKEGLSTAQTTSLRDVALLPVANASRLVPASHCCVRLKEDLSPLAYELPSKYVARMELLKSLGCHETPNAQWLIGLLKSLAEVVGNRPLNANQRTAVMRVLVMVHGLTSPSDVNAVTAAKAAGQLKVPSADSRLCNPSEVVMLSAGGAKLLGRVDTRQLRFVHPQLPRNVAQWLGCAEVQDKVEEVLDEAAGLQKTDSVGGLTLSATQQLLVSHCFIEAVFASVQAHVHSVKGLNTMTVQQVAAALRHLANRLVFVQELSTRVVMRGTMRDVTQRDSTSGLTHVYEFDCTRTKKLYIAEPPAGLSAAWLLASAVSRAVGSPVVLPLQPLFACPEDRVQQLQSILLPGGWNEQLEMAGRAGEPGAPLHPADARSLLLKPLRRYAAGELVAVPTAAVLVAARDAGVAHKLIRGSQAVSAQNLAAEAAQKRAAQTATDASPTADTAQQSQGWASVSEGLQSMCYARVATDAAPSGTAPLYHVPVEVEPGVVVPLLSIHVYSFRSYVGSDDHDTDDDNLVTSHFIAARDSSTGGGQLSGSNSNRASTSGTNTTETGNATDVILPRKDPNQAPVAAGQLVGAVKDLLAAAGLPVSLQQAELLEQAAAIKLELTDAQTQLKEAREQLSAQSKELEGSKGAWQCKICYTRDVDACFTGCGHMMCHTCCSGLDRCPVCRKRSHLIKLFK